MACKQMRAERRIGQWKAEHHEMSLVDIKAVQSLQSSPISVSLAESILMQYA